MNILIIGYGVVGKNMRKVFPDADIYDPGYVPIWKEQFDFTKQYDVAFICVPTEPKPDGSADVSIVRKAIEEHMDHVEVFCIRSTVPPSTTEGIGEFNGIRTVFSPEYFGGSIHANVCDYDFIILGGERENTKIVAEAYKEAKHPSFKIIQTDSRTAELVKYMENSWLATKVTFCNEFYRIAEKINVDYNELRELFLMDPRVTRSHTFVYEDQPYYDSHCLNKDIPALIRFAETVGYSPLLMQSVLTANIRHKEMALGNNNSNVH